MKKSVLIGIIVGAVVLVGVIAGVLAIPFNNGGSTTKTTTTTITTTTTATTTSKPACKHDDPSQVVIVDAVAPTCYATGLTEGMKCNACGTMVLPQMVVQTLDCIEGDWIVDKEPTITEEGLKHTECTVCGKKTSEGTIPRRSDGLEYILNEDGVSYSVSAIGSCTDTDILIPKYFNGYPVTSIGDCAFWECTSLTSVVIPNSVTSIGTSAFGYCTSLTRIVIHDSVTSIGNFAFFECTSLTIYCKSSLNKDGWGPHWDVLNLNSDTYQIYYVDVVWDYTGN